VRGERRCTARSRSDGRLWFGDFPAREQNPREARSDSFRRARKFDPDLLRQLRQGVGSRARALRDIRVCSLRSLPLEEQQPSGQFFSELTWISWSVSEELSGSLSFEEPSFSQTNFEPVLWFIAPPSEDFLSAASSLEESATPVVLIRTLALSLFSATEEFVGEEVPPPPPPPPLPPPIFVIPARQVVHVSGSGLNFFDREREVETEGCEVVDSITVDDIRCLVDEIRVRAETEEVKSWTKKKLAGQKGQTPRAKVLLREAQEVPSIDPICGSAPLARVTLFGSAAMSDGLDVRIAVHSYSGDRVDRVLIAVLVDGEWQYADPNGSLPFGHAMPFSSVRFYEPARKREVKITSAAAIDQNLQQMVNAILAESPTETRAIRPAKSRRIPGIWLVLAGVLIGIALVPSTPPPKRRKRRRRRRRR
jgi:hypothetical protein